MNMKLLTEKDLEELKKLYEESKTEELFIFKGDEILVPYAQYLIEFLETKFKRR